MGDLSLCFSLLFFISYNFDNLVLHLKNGGLPMFTIYNLPRLPMFTIYNVLRFTNVYNYQFTMEMLLTPQEMVSWQNKAFWSSWAVTRCFERFAASGGYVTVGAALCIESSRSKHCSSGKTKNHLKSPNLSWSR